MYYKSFLLFYIAGVIVLSSVRAGQAVQSAADLARRQATEAAQAQRQHQQRHAAAARAAGRAVRQ